ncbi:MAG: glycosyltransferase family 4 protein [Halomonadaceae bacterium]|jgi:glycosyltransferase involved in cell wall biosynthesis
MIKILYVVSTLKRSGPTNQLFNILKYLDRSVFEPHVVTLSPELEDSRWNDYVTLEIGLESLCLSRIAGAFLAKHRLSGLVKKIKPDLVHTQGLRSDVLSAKLGGFPNVATIRNFPQLDYPMTYGELQGRWMAYHHVKELKKIRKCIGVSEAVSENLSSQYSLSNVATIKNGVDTDIYHPVSPSFKVELRRRLGLPENRDVWISSGHLVARKSPLKLIDAWKSSSFFDDKHLVFIGSGELYDQCRLEAKGRDNIHVVGRVNNVVEYLQASDFYISASQAEGLPNAVLEGLACGLPVVLSDIGPHREIWEMSKTVGKLFDLSSKPSLLKAIQDQYAENRLATETEALKLIRERLSAEVMSKQYQRVYENLS